MANIFTKPVGKEALQRACQGLGLTPQQGTVAQQFPASLLRETVEGNITMVGDMLELNRAYGVCRGQVTIDDTKPHIGGYACGMHRHYHDNLGAM